MSLQQFTAQGLSPQQWKILLDAHPQQIPKVTDSLAQVQREAGKQELIQWMKEKFGCPL
jgi:hypothetical protein